MSTATLDGKAIALEDAYKEAARILAGARFPVVAGLGADVPGARAAILLAERLRGAFDHLASAEALTDLEVMRSFDLFYTTPNEARVRADLIVFVGPGLTRLWPGMMERLAPQDAPVRGAQAGAARKLYWIGPEAGEAPAGVTVIEAKAQQISGVLAAWRARVGGRRLNFDVAKLEKIDGVAEALKAAKFGVFVWSASAGLDSLAVETLQALVTDLNVTTRFTGIPIGARAGAAGVIQTSGWMTGFPPRTGFGRGYPEHDPWRFDAKRLVDSGEADAALWVSAYDGEAPPWSASVPTVTLAPEGGSAKGLFIQVGRPGVDHDAVEFSQEIGAIRHRPASAPNAVPSAAQALEAILAHVPEAQTC